MKAYGIGIGKSSTHSLPVHYMETSNDAWSGKEIQTLSCTKVWKNGILKQVAQKSLDTLDKHSVSSYFCTTLCT